MSIPAWAHRIVDAVLYTRAGLEIGVAATKTFTAQTALLSLLALKLAQVRRTLPAEEIEFILEERYDLPERMEFFLEGNHPIEEIAERHQLSGVSGVSAGSTTACAAAAWLMSSPR